MGTTLVCTVSTPERVYCMNVGDSRMYSADADIITRVTKDHSYVQYLVDSGAISTKEAENHRDREKTYPKHNFEELFHVIFSSCYHPVRT